MASGSNHLNNTPTWHDIGARLRRTREHAGFTQQQAAEELGVRPAAISQYESGKRRIDAIALDRLGRLYGVPISYFLDGEHPEQDWETALRGQARDLSVGGKRGISELIEKLRGFEDLHRRTGVHSDGRLHPPFEPLEPRAFPENDIALLAERTRRHFDLGTAPMLDLREFLAMHGYHIFSIPLGSEPDDLSGLFFVHPELGPIIAVNEDQAFTRRPFTLAHELAHALFHYQLPAILCRSRSSEPRERFANRFATHFLVPDDALAERLIKNKIGKVANPDIVIDLARYFGVSYGAMLWRLRTAGLLDQPDDDRWRIRPLTRAIQLGYTPTRWELGERPVPLEERFPRQYLDLALQAARDGILSERRVAELLDVSHLEFQELLHPETLVTEEPEEVYV